MASPSLDTVVIACPACATRYQVPASAIVAGRQAQCANCGQVWEPTLVAAEDTLFDAAAEQELDAAFEAEAMAAGRPPAAPDNPGPGPARMAQERLAAGVTADRADPAVADERARAALARRRQSDFSARQKSLSDRLPLGRIRRGVRLGAIALAALVIGGGIWFRTEIVRELPDLAGLYAAVGLPVNVEGLEFADLRTLDALRDGRPVLSVTARIVSVADHPVNLPAVIVTLIDDSGAPIYQWRASPPVRVLAPGGATLIETQLSDPPSGARRVRLTFGSGGPQPPAQTIQPPTEPAH